MADRRELETPWRPTPRLESSRVRRFLVGLGPPAAIGALVLSIAVLLRWQERLLLVEALEGWRLMRGSTATAVILLSCSLLLLRSTARGRRTIAGLVLAGAAGLIGAGNVIFHLGLALSWWDGVSLGRFDSITYPMSAQTAVWLVAFSAAVMCSRATVAGAERISDMLSWATLAALVVFFDAFVFQAPQLLSEDGASLTPALTTVCLTLLFLAWWSDQVRRGRWTALAAAGRVGRVLRVTVPALVLAPVLLVLLVQTGLRREWFDGGEALAITSIAFSALLTMLLIMWAVAVSSSQGELVMEAMTDRITGLLNHRALVVFGMHLLEDARREATPFTVIFFDLNGLKEVNDTEGHRAGDQLIADFAAALRSTFRSADVVGRYGGDEFVVLIKGTDEQAAAGVARLTAHIDSDDRSRRLSYAHGIATTNPGERLEFDELVRLADDRMYQEKRRTKSVRRTVHRPTPRPGSSQAESSQARPATESPGADDGPAKA